MSQPIILQNFWPKMLRTERIFTISQCIALRTNDIMSSKVFLTNTTLVTYFIVHSHSIKTIITFLYLTQRLNLFVFFLFCIG